MSPGIPFNPLTTAFHTSPNDPLPITFCRFIFVEAISQQEEVTERYLVPESFPSLQKTTRKGNSALINKLYAAEVA